MYIFICLLCFCKPLPSNLPEADCTLYIYERLNLLYIWGKVMMWTTTPWQIKDTDKYEDKDKDKETKRPNMCYIFETQGCMDQTRPDSIHQSFAQFITSCICLIGSFQITETLFICICIPRIIIFYLFVSLSFGRIWCEGDLMESFSDKIGHHKLIPHTSRLGFIQHIPSESLIENYHPR